MMEITLFIFAIFSALISLTLALRYKKKKLNDISIITDRERELIETRMNLNLAVESANLSIWVYEVQQCKIYTVRGDLPIPSGSSYDDMIESIDESYRKEFDDKFNSLLTGDAKNQTFVGNIYVKSCDTGIYYETKMLPLVDDSTGKVIRIIGTLKDVTDHYNYQKTLEERNRKISFAIKASRLVHWDYDNRTCMFYYNEDTPVFDKTSRSLDAFMSNIHPDDVRLASPIIDQMNLGVDKEYLIHIRMKTEFDGEWRNIILSVVPLEKNGHGIVLRYTGFRRDNTEWTRLNEELTALNNKITFILDNTNSGMAFITSDHIVQWENASKVLGFNDYREGEFCYKNKGFDGPCDDCILKRALESGEIASKEIITPDGIVYEQFATPVYNYTENLHGVVLRIDDITQRKKTFIELCEAKDKAEESDRLKSSFIANMSHEIRTPLNAIVGFSDLLTECEIATEDRSEYVSVIKKNNKLLLQMVSDVLDLSQIEAGVMKFNYDMVNLNDLCSRVKLTVTNSSRADVPIVFDEETPQLYLFTDESKLNQILINFITNAIKFTSEGSIEVGVRLIEETHVEIFVKDTGTGIALDNIEAIFERFVKLDSFIQGTGLGLSVCRKLAEQLGGEVGVESKVGVGSKFWIRLPYNNIEKT